MNADELPKTLRKYAAIIEGVEDYRKSESAYWVHLKNGWINTFDETHSICEDNIGECVRVLRESVKPCKGDCCSEVPLTPGEAK